MMDRTEYCEMLLRRRDKDIPEAIKKHQEIIKDLTQESKAVDEELKHLIKTAETKTIFDLPPLTWEIIGKEFTHPKNEIYELCLASEKFAEMMDQVFPEHSMFYENARKVFSLLVSNCYLDGHDLINCIDTGSEHLGMLASVSWRFLENQRFCLVSLNSNESVARVLREIQIYKDEQRIWRAFVSQTFHMNSTISNSPGWEVLNKYGKFVVNIKIVESSDDPTWRTSRRILRMLTSGKLPNLQYFFVTMNKLGMGDQGVYGIDAKLHHLTLQTNFRLWTYRSPLQTPEIFQSSSEVAKVWRCEHDTNTFPVGVHFKMLEQILLKNHLSKVFLQTILGRVEHNRFQIKKIMLTIFPSEPQEFIDFGLNFPNLSEVVLNLRQIRMFPIPSRTLSSVKTITIIWDINSSLARLHQLFMAFPRLISFNIKTNFTMEQFVERINQLLELERGQRLTEHLYDVYHFLSIGESLAQSNIWNEIPRLTSLSVTTARSNERYYVPSYLIHKYTRIDGNRVTFQRIRQSKWKYFPCPFTF